MRVAKFPEVLRGWGKVSKDREIAHCYCIVLQSVIAVNYYEVVHACAKLCMCVNGIVKNKRVGIVINTVLCTLLSVF